MIRLSTQFDRAVSRPVVAAPKSHGCCCCCCCCIVTVAGFSVVTARSTFRALRAFDGLPKPATQKPAMDGWTTRPVEGAPPAEPAAPADPAVAEAKPASAVQRDVKTWTAVAALILPISLCVAPAMLAGVATVLENRAELGTNGAGWATTALTVASFVGLCALLRLYARLGPLGIGLLTAPILLSVGAVLVDDFWFGPPIVLFAEIFIGGLIALARRGVPTKTVVTIGVLAPIALAIEFGLWLAVLVGGVMR